MCGSLGVILEFCVPQYACKNIVFSTIVSSGSPKPLVSSEHGGKQGCLISYSSQRITVLDEIPKGRSLRNTKLNETERALKFDGMSEPFFE